MYRIEWLKRAEKALAAIPREAQERVGVGHVCVRHRSDEVTCWGWNFVGELGDGTMVDRASPVAVVDP